MSEHDHTLLCVERVEPKGDSPQVLMEMATGVTREYNHHQLECLPCGRNQLHPAATGESAGCFSRKGPRFSLRYILSRMLSQPQQAEAWGSGHAGRWLPDLNDT